MLLTHLKVWRIEKPGKLQSLKSYLDFILGWFCLDFFSSWSYHWITEWLSLEEISGDHVVQPPWWSRFTQRRLHRITSRQVLNISRDGDSTASLGSLFLCSATHIGKFLLLFGWNESFANPCFEGWEKEEEKDKKIKCATELTEHIYFKICEAKFTFTKIDIFLFFRVRCCFHFWEKQICRRYS